MVVTVPTRRSHGPPLRSRVLMATSRVLIATAVMVLLITDPGSIVAPVPDGRSYASVDYTFRHDPRWRLETFPGLLETDPDGFQDLFRLSPIAFNYVLSMVEKDLTPRRTGRLRNSRNYLTAKEKLGIFMYICAQDANMQVASTQWGVSKATCSRVLHKVAKAIKRNLFHIHVKWPDDDEQDVTAQIFQTMRGIPNIIGCIDGTHIPVKAPRKFYSSFLNRKGWTSINVLAICNEKLKFIYICCGAPGCVHDARVWQHTKLYRDFLAGKKRKHGYYLLGDAAYGNTSLCICPFPSDDTPRKINFNYCHSSVRMAIERTFGKFKAQWQLFGVSAPRYYPKQMSNLVLAAATLHNITVDIDNAGWHPSYTPAQCEVEVPTTHDDRVAWSTYAENMSYYGTQVRNAIADQITLIRTYRQRDL